MKTSIQNLLTANDENENDETGQPIYSEDTEPTEQSFQVHESNLTPRDFMPKIPTEDQIAANIRRFNKKQRMVFDVLLQWAKKYVTNVSSKKNLQINPVYVFLCGSGGTRKTGNFDSWYKTRSQITWVK